jgi:probable HAF family extracellular repeat protein
MTLSVSRIRWLVCGALLAIGLASEPVARADRPVRMYELIELKSSDEGSTRAYAINNVGQVVGWIQVDQNRHSAQWHNRVTTDLHGTVHFALQHPLFDQDYSEAFDISSGGQIVGTARTTIECPDKFTVTHAFILRPAVLTDLATPYPGDALANLGTLGDPCLCAYDSAAIGISNSNHVVGWADRIDGVIHAILVRPADGQFYRDDDDDLVNDLMIDLGTLAASDPVSAATAVNDAGQVTGYSYTSSPDGSGSYHAFLLTPLDADQDGVGDTWYVGNNGVNDLMTDLGTLGGPNSWGRDINNQGQIVGESDYDAPTGEHYTRAFLWSSGTMTDLGTLRTDPRHGFSAASAINDKGVVVGWAENEDRERRAFIYENGEMRDLNDLLYLFTEEGSVIVPGIVLTEARDINDDGVIVGWGAVRTAGSTNTRGFILNPILVDPRVLEQQQEQIDSGGTDDTTPTDDDTDTSGPTGPPDFSGPDGSAPDTSTGPQETGTSPGFPLALCGAGTLTLLPLTLAGWCWLRHGQRRCTGQR